MSTNNLANEKGEILQETVPQNFDNPSINMNSDGQIAPTEEELATLPRVAARLPWTAYLLCVTDFAERASFWGFRGVFANFIRAPLPVGGNGAGAPANGTQQTAGALGKGTVVASAMGDAFGILAYSFPLLGGWIADVYWGRLKTMYVGAVVMGFACIILVISAIPSVIQSGNAIIPFGIGMYTLCLGTGILKANISPAILDQSPHKKPHVVTKANGEKAIIDPEMTTERMMLWMFLALQVGGLMGIATSFLAKYEGFWAAFLVPTCVWLLVPALLYFIDHGPWHLVKLPPGGSELGDLVRIHVLCLRKAGFGGLVRGRGFYDHARPSVLEASGDKTVVPWDDKFVDDVRRTMEACAVFCFIPLSMINDGGLGASGNAQSAALTSNGVPNDLIDNLNPITTISVSFLLNVLVLPGLEKMGIKFGSIRRMTAGFLFSAIGASAFAVIQHHIYKTSPCGYQASSCEEGTGVSPLSLWLYAIPTVVTAVSEPLVFVPAWSLAYARSPPNMKGFVMAVSWFSIAVGQMVSLASAGAVRDPNLVWVFAVPSILGVAAAIVFWILFRHLDQQEFFLGERTISSEQRSASPKESSA